VYFESGVVPVGEAFEQGDERAKRPSPPARAQPSGAQPSSERSSRWTPTSMSVDLAAALLPLVRRRLEGKVTLMVDGEPELWSADLGTRALDQMVQMLVERTVTVLPDGGVLAITIRNVRVDWWDESPSLPCGDYVCLQMADSRPSAGPDAARVDDERSRRAGAIVERIRAVVELAGGEVHQKSTLGRGGRVAIYLKRATG
jgi:hypothetical protein